MGGVLPELSFGKIKSNVISLPLSVFDGASLKRDTGFVPEISFEEGVRSTVRWIIESRRRK